MQIFDCHASLLKLQTIMINKYDRKFYQLTHNQKIKAYTRKGWVCKLAPSKVLYCKMCNYKVCALMEALGRSILSILSVAIFSLIFIAELCILAHFCGKDKQTVNRKEPRRDPLSQRLYVLKPKVSLLSGCTIFFMFFKVSLA